MSLSATDQSERLEALAESDLRLALGPNADPYLRYWDLRQRRGFWALAGWNWWGLLLPLPWLFYRKLWRIGATLIMLPILMEAQFGWGAQAGLLLAALIAAGGKPLVLERTRRKIWETASLNLVPSEATERLHRAGGVSTTGALFGTLLTASYVGLVFGVPLPQPLPACHAPAVVRMVLDIASDDLSDQIALNDRIELANPNPTENDELGGQLCHGDILAGSLTLPVRYRVRWENQAQRIIAVELHSRSQDDRSGGETSQ